MTNEMQRVNKGERHGEIYYFRSYNRREPDYVKELLAAVVGESLWEGGGQAKADAKGRKSL
jgi:hypothetical protein